MYEIQHQLDKIFFGFETRNETKNSPYEKAKYRRILYYFNKIFSQIIQITTQIQFDGIT